MIKGKTCKTCKKDGGSMQGPCGSCVRTHYALSLDNWEEEIEKVGIKKFKSKPIEVEAVQWGTEEAFDFLKEQLGESNLTAFHVIQNYAEFSEVTMILDIKNSNPLEPGYHQSSIKLKMFDWIVKNSENELGVLPDKDFKKMFEPTAP